MPHWGSIADDVTGATDLAGNLVARGYSTVVLFGLEALRDPRARAQAAAVDAVVAALKSRTAPVATAVSQSLEALRFLQELGAERIYVKYCSTFDSTPRGNIGPVIDAVLESVDEPVTIVVPSFPDAGRTVYQGHLFVGPDLLSDSSMRFHPLTPMTDSSLPRLLTPQTVNQVTTIGIETVRAGIGVLRERLRSLAAGGGRTLAVVDAIDNDDLKTISAATTGLRVITGGSGLALGLDPAGSGEHAPRIRIAAGKRVVLSGSASLRTREQVAFARSRAPWRRLELDALRVDLDGEVARTVAWTLDQWDRDTQAAPVVYSVDDLADLDYSHPDFDPSLAVEEAFGRIARRLVDAGARQLIVAGGETSGRVLAELGVRALRIGPSIDAGVSWSEGLTGSGELINISLKSGNFGQPDLFVTSWRLLERVS